MCILFIYTNPSPPKNGYRLIVASNRDEDYNRPARHAFHCTGNNIIGGRDMEEGGMWFGVSLNESNKYKLRLGCLLNVTGESHVDDAEGRGAIILNYLKQEIGTDDYAKAIEERVYRAYNFISVEISNDHAITHHRSNRPTSCSKYEGLQILGFGNSTTTTPLQKVLNGKSQFEEIIKSYGTASKEELVERLTGFLKNEKRFLPDVELQRRSPMYEHLSSIFVKIPEYKYGTRAHSIVLVSYDWSLHFVEIALEQPIDVNNFIWRTSQFTIDL
ncbi:hypothetical protein FQR65_LT10818 [Abscondita terminalis]|nr:hypothetical protein FQR65_LT10818 [Abscondita terminalis]